MNDNAKPHLLGLLAGLFLAAGLVLAAMTVTRAWLRISESQTVTVTGSARRNVRADLMIWHGHVSAEAVTLLEAQRALKDGLDKVAVFLKSRDVTNSLILPISIEELRAPDRTRVAGYRLAQSVELRSDSAERVAQLDHDSARLVEEGVLFTSGPTDFIYTKAGEAKVEMLAQATKDARARADQIASQGGRRISRLRSARMGVFQITPIYSRQTSWEGIYDTTSLEKTITAVVTASFSMN
jgi:uncharacterized protein